MNEKTEMQKCKESMSYFAEKHGMIKTPQGMRKFNKREIALLKEYEKAGGMEKDRYILKLRKHYK